MWVWPRITGASAYLHRHSSDEALMTGRSVLQTALSSLSAGFDTLLVEPAMRGINEGSSDAAFEKVEGSGGKVVGRNGEDWEGPLKDWIGSDRDDDDFLYNKSCRAI